MGSCCNWVVERLVGSNKYWNRVEVVEGKTLGSLPPKLICRHWFEPAPERELGQVADARFHYPSD